ncbi:hypothetical protein [Herbaspirillum huttiense]|uniref:hypothetical protein n=1 Tax=Herbaspirillum huttiense TaxID=863372 RepID=UPI0039AFC266
MNGYADGQTITYPIMLHCFPPLRRLLLTLPAWLVLTATPMLSHGQPDDGTAQVCAEVEVNGVRAPSYACLTQKLKPATVGAANGETRPAAPTGAEQIINRPGNQLGVFNHSALSNRMGNALGNSVFPQRPADGR